MFASMLSREDLESIRRIVREELARVGPATISPGPVAEAVVDGDELLAEFARARASVMRGIPGSTERALAAEARYRARHDESWQARVRRRRPSGADPHAPVTDDEMLAVLKAHRARYRRKAR